MYVLIYLIVNILVGCLCNPVRHSLGMNSSMLNAMGYLSQYQYIGDNNPDPHAATLIRKDPIEATRRGILLFQQRYKLQETGTLTQETVDLMAKPRCGLPDINNSEETRRRKRYITRGGTWPKTRITYRISQYTQDNDLTPAQIDRELRKAFELWEEVTPLRFIQKRPFEQVEIDIKFAGGNHGDGFAFDGRGSVLAHAFYPKYGGNTHFDEAEVWTVDTNEGTNLFQVAAHEFGHALGLAHSDNAISLMAPFYQGYQPNYILPEDDVLGIQSLYGLPRADDDDGDDDDLVDEKTTTMTTTQKPTTTTPKKTTTPRRKTTTTEKPTTTKPRRKTTTTATTTTTTTQKPTTTTPRKTTEKPKQHIPDICSDSQFDAITVHVEHSQKRIYAFKDNFYYKIKDNKIAHGYPRSIKYDWPGLPSNVDAALFWDAEYKSYWNWNKKKKDYEISKKISKPARTYFFKGSKYWRFEHRRLLPGYPKDITSWGLPHSVDSAFVWSGNGMTYFTKGSKYYRYTRGSGVDRGYPKSLSAWAGLPHQIDAAFQYGGKTYFFKGSKFYEFQDNHFKVADDFPKQTSNHWLGCKNWKPHFAHLISSSVTNNKVSYLTLLFHLITVTINLRHL